MIISCWTLTFLPNSSLCSASTSCSSDVIFFEKSPLYQEEVSSGCFWEQSSKIGYLHVLIPVPSTSIKETMLIFLAFFSCALGYVCVCVMNFFQWSLSILLVWNATDLHTCFQMSWVLFVFHFCSLRSSLFILNL